MLKINWKTLTTIGLLFLIGVVFCILRNCEMFQNCTVSGMKAYLISFGIFAPLIYIVLFALIPLTLFPDAILAIAGGMVFGVYFGTLYTMIGALCGSTISFYIARRFGRSVVEKLLKDKAQSFEDGVEKRGFLLIFLLRLMPLVPFDVISYGAGFSKIKYKDFFTATLLGIIPGVMVYSNLGDKSGNLLSKEFVMASVILILLMLVSYLVKKKCTFEKMQEKFTGKTKAIEENAD